MLRKALLTGAALLALTTGSQAAPLISNLGVDPNATVCPGIR